MQPNKGLHGHPDFMQIERNLNMKRKSAKTLTAIITGHEDLQWHLCKLQLINYSIWRYCQWEEETPYHILYKCTTISSTRGRLTGIQFLEVQETVLTLWRGLVQNKFLNIFSLEMRICLFFLIYVEYYLFLPMYRLGQNKFLCIYFFQNAI